MNICWGLQMNILLHIKAAPVFISKSQIPLPILCLMFDFGKYLRKVGVLERNEMSSTTIPSTTLPSTTIPSTTLPSSVIPRSGVSHLTIFQEDFWKILFCGLKYCDWGEPWDNLALGPDQRRLISTPMGEPGTHEEKNSCIQRRNLSFLSCFVSLCGEQGGFFGNSSAPSTNTSLRFSAEHKEQSLTLLLLLHPRRLCWRRRPGPRSGAWRSCKDKGTFWEENPRNIKVGRGPEHHPV